MHDSPASSQDFSQRSKLHIAWGDRLLQTGMAMAAAVPVGIIVAVIAIFFYQSVLFLQEVPLGRLMGDRDWTPMFINPQFGILVLITSTLLVVGIALLVAVPIGVMAAFYLSEYAPNVIRQILKPALEALSGIPTIVYGYFALLFLTPKLQLFIPGLSTFNALSAGIVTGLLIVPLISSVSQDAIDNVPNFLRQGAYSLGMTKAEAIAHVIFPTVLPGIVASITLAASRALGETMIASIAAGQYPQITLNPLVPVETMTGFIIQVSLGDVESDSLLFHTIFVVGTVLFLLTFGLNALGRSLLHRHAQVLEQFSIPLTAVHFSPLSTMIDFGANHLASMDLPAFYPSITVRLWLNRCMTVLGFLCASTGVATFVVIVLVAFRRGFTHLDWQFLTSYASRNPEEAGILAAFMGTLWILGLTAFLVFPIGLGAALYLEEYVPEGLFSRFVNLNLVNLTAIPSILYGLLGLDLLGRRLGHLTGGSSILSGAFVMTLIALPLFITTTRSALRAVPKNLRLAGQSVGMTRWQIVWHVVLPSAFPGIVTAMMMSLSRIIGEAAPLIALGALAYITFSPELSLAGLQSRFTTLPTQIFYWASRPQLEFQEDAAAAIIVLGSMVLFMSIIAALLREKSRQHYDV
jgi:phosphate transport system permease protein